jgi:hypothetical protein
MNYLNFLGDLRTSKVKRHVVIKPIQAPKNLKAL